MRKELKRILQAAGPSRLIISWDVDAFARLRHDEREFALYHLGRLLRGETTAEIEWGRYGLAVEVEPDMDQGPE